MIFERKSQMPPRENDKVVRVAQSLSENRTNHMPVTVVPANMSVSNIKSN